jgi:hypothetical protein
MLARRLNRPLAVVTAALVIGGGAYGIVGTSSGNGTAGAGTAQTATAGSSAQARPGAGAAFGAAQPGGSNARSGPAAGGTTGTVGSVSTSGFTVSTSAGQTVTVQPASSTTYRNGTTPASASAVKKGAPVLVLGTTDGTTITATLVIVRPTGGGSGTSSASTVVPFKRGAPTTSKQIGQVPANYTEGSGTIVSGTTANRATQAALAAYPGGVVDRVVKLSNGEYEVHNIGVNWPHHVFVSTTFKVVGAN